MLFLQFQLDQNRYALEAKRVVEVVPLLDLTPLPQAPRGVAGIFNYRGAAVVAVDLSELILSRPARASLSTRILIVNLGLCPEETRWVGLIAENATRILRKEPAEFQAPAVNSPDSPAGGAVWLDLEGAIQWVREDQLLPEAVLRMLRQEPAVLTDVGH